MSELVIDASVAIKWVIKGEPFRNKANQLYKNSIEKGISLIAPPIFEYEIESSLQRRLYHKQETTLVIDGLLTHLYKAGIKIINQLNMIKRGRQIAREFNQKAIYDSTYAALAELRNCDFWTADKKFYNAVSSKLNIVKLIENYPIPR